MCHFSKNDTSINQPDVRFEGQPEKLYFNVDEKLQRALDAAGKHIDK